MDLEKEAKPVAAGKCLKDGSLEEEKGLAFKSRV